MRVFALPFTLALAAVVATPALADNRTMALSGTGIVRAAPDMATISTGVTTQSQTAREALSANTRAMEELIEVLRGAGIESRDIQTTQFSVNPQYDYSNARDGSEPRPPEIVGYQVTNAVTVTVRDLDALGPVLDRAITAGANTVGGISFGVDDTDALLDEARRRAVAQALETAEVYADAAGISLGSILSISEQDRHEPPRPMFAAARMEMASDAAVPVEAGEMTYSITATITWDIED